MKDFSVCSSLEEVTCKQFSNKWEKWNLMDINRGILPDDVSVDMEFLKSTRGISSGLSAF